MEIVLPEMVSNIIGTLNNAGFEAFTVGGCVRDSILGRQPEDWDIATNAKPQEVKLLFPKTIDTGLKHGTVTVISGGQGFEITTYRLDGEYLDGRRPKRVSFTSSLKDDLSRRDFTINAMAFNGSTGILDCFEGLKDMESGIIRTVGDPDERFKEDALRMLRAVRFASQLDFVIEGNTFKALERNSGLIKKISSERIRDELTKTIVSDHPDKFLLLKETGLLRNIIPELDECFGVAQNHPYHIYNVGIHTLVSVSNIEKDTVLRWTMLLHDIGKPHTRSTDSSGRDHFYGHPLKSMEKASQIMKRLKFDNRAKDKILNLVKNHDRTIEPGQKAVRKALRTLGDETFTDLMKVKEADKRAQNPDFLNKSLDRLSRIKATYDAIKLEKHCTSLKDLAINGHDLINLGYRPGMEIGDILEKLLDAVIENPEMNSREKLMELLEDKK